MYVKPETLRLDRYLSAQLGVSRNDAKELIKKRQVTVNGEIAKLYDMKIVTGSDTVSVNGKEINYRKYVYIMLNKPAGVVCAVKDELSPTVLELIPQELRRKGLFPAGRLDKDTEGFVFITDDGELAHRMLSPKSHVDKIYYAELDHEADQSYIERFAEGMTIDGDERCLPAKIELLPDRKKVYITLHEGKYHQVKRMIHALGNEVVFLKRVQIGGLPLDDRLPLGSCREIMHKEIEKIYTK